MFGQQSERKTQRYAFNLFHDSNSEPYAEPISRTLGLTYSNGQARPLSSADLMALAPSNHGSSYQLQTLTSQASPGLAVGQVGRCQSDGTQFSSDVLDSRSGNFFQAAASRSSDSPPSSSSSYAYESRYSSELLCALDNLLLGG